MTHSLEEVVSMLEKLDKRISRIEKKLDIKPITDIEILRPAFHVLMKNNQISTSLLQRSLKITKKESIDLYERLETMGVIKTKEVNHDPTQPYKVGSISKYKIKRYFAEYL